MLPQGAMPAVFSSAEVVSDGRTAARLQEVYNTQIKPLEDMYHYDVLRPGNYGSTLSQERPCITFLGPWSAGKTSFINYLLQSNHLWTGPQPTTADFTAINFGLETGPVEGRALVHSKTMPFKELEVFGEEMLRHFKGFQMPHPLLRHLTLIDTPGIMETSNTHRARTYNYHGVCRWFAERSDLIFVLFDPSKLETGEQMRTLFEKTLSGLEQRVRIVLNKADTVSSQELMKVYGGLFWNLAALHKGTEPPRVYVGSFWDRPYNQDSFSLLFSEEKTDLLHEIMQLVPQQAWDKKVTDTISRSKSVLAHAAICSVTRSKFPKFNRSKGAKKAIQKLSEAYEEIAAEYHLNPSDFPTPSEYEHFLETVDFADIHDIEKAEKRGLIASIRDAMDVTLPKLLRPRRGSGAPKPEDKEDRGKLEKSYMEGLRSQLAGSERFENVDSGSDGGSEVVINIPNPFSRSRRESSGGPTAGGVPASATSRGSYAFADNGTNRNQMDTTAQMMMMMQMMMMQQQQKQQQQQNASRPLFDGYQSSGRRGSALPPIHESPIHSARRRSENGNAFE